MKKVLALVLALTMVLGFAATASAYWNVYKTDFFDGAIPVPEVGGMPYDDGMNVEGNKEYTIKYKFQDTEINPPLGSVGAAYDSIYNEKRVLDVINSYAAGDFLTTGDWTIVDINSLGHQMLKAAMDAIDTTDAADVRATSTWATLITSGTTFEEAYKSGTFQAKKAEVERAWVNYYSTNSYYGYEDGIAVSASSKDPTYVSVTSQPTVSAKRVNGHTEFTVEFKVRFTNTTFRTADAEVEVVFNAGGVGPDDYYETKDTLSFTVFQAQYRTFTEQDALIAFGVTPNVEISADDYAYISADAFRLMLQNSSRSITVVSGMGDSKVRFDKDSTNLPQDVFVGNFTTSANSDSVSINGFSSTTSAKIKIAVGRSFYNANNGKVISVYDANGNKLDVEATLQGDYTVNFYAPLSNYTVAGTDWAGQTVPGTDAGKNNPSMGGAF